jgi:hypothetical protein
MDTPMLLSSHRAARPVIPTRWHRFTNVIAWCLAALIAQPILAWDHLRSSTWQDWAAIPGHLLHFALRAVAALWGLSILLAAAGALLAIPVGLAWMLGTLAWRGLGW